MEYLVLVYIAYQILGMTLLWLRAFTLRDVDFRENIKRGLKILFLWPLVLREEYAEQARRERWIQQLEKRYDRSSRKTL